MAIKKWLMIGFGLGLLSLGSIGAGYLLAKPEFWSTTRNELVSPFVRPPLNKPLEKYSIPQLVEYPFKASVIKLGAQLDQTDQSTSYDFSFVSMDSSVSGQIIWPKNRNPSLPVVIMVRGYVPMESYQTGIGTAPAGKYFASQGFVTIAPDFLGYGKSDPEPSDPWQARLVKPITLIELIKSVRDNGITAESIQLPAQSNVVLWGHSNGGQIALTALEILQEPIATTLWAPVTAPFPYSVLFYSDENQDEGKAVRAWVAKFEETYDVFDFSLTQHLDKLVGPIQIHHGTTDEAVPKSWSDEFVDKLVAENLRRSRLDDQASNSGQLRNSIEYDYFVYAGADHNLRPPENWSLAVQRDVEFFKQATAD